MNPDNDQLYYYYEEKNNSHICLRYEYQIWELTRASISNNSSVYNYDLLSKIPNFEIKAARNHFVFMNYLPQQTVELWLHCLDSLLIDNYVICAGSTTKAHDLFLNHYRRYIKLIPNPNTLYMGGIISKLIDKQKILDELSGHNDLERIFGDLTGNLKLLTPYLNSSSFEEDYYQVMRHLIP